MSMAQVDAGMALNTSHLQSVEAAIKAVHDHFPGIANSQPLGVGHGLVTHLKIGSTVKGSMFVFFDIPV